MSSYNCLKYLKKDIIQLISLTYPHYRCIIVDNMLSQGSVAFIKEIKNDTRNINKFLDILER